MIISTRRTALCWKINFNSYRYVSNNSTTAVRINNTSTKLLYNKFEYDDDDNDDDDLNSTL